MNKMSNFIVKYNNTIVNITVSTAMILSTVIGLMPFLVESYTVNLYLNNKIDIYFEYNKVFEYLLIVSFIFVSVNAIYVLIRNKVDNIPKIQLDIKFSLFSFLSVLSLISIFFLNNGKFEERNNEIISNKIISVKNDILNGNCKKVTPPHLVEDINDCGNTENNMVGQLYYEKAGISSIGSVDKKGKQIIDNISRPDTITYALFMPLFCSSLTDSSHVLHKEFNSIKFGSKNVLSEDFDESRCFTDHYVSKLSFEF